MRSFAHLPAIRAYKYLPSRYAAAAACLGRFKIARLSTFRSSETGEMADTDDSIMVRRIDRMEFDASGSDEQRKMRETVGDLFEVPPDKRAFLGGLNVHRAAPDEWALSLTESETNVGPPNYDAKLEIRDVVAFAAAIQRAHPEHLGGSSSGRVVYRTQVYEGVAGYHPPSAFAKEPRFAAQREIRIVWKARSQRVIPLFTLSSEAANLVRLVYRAE